MTAYRNVPLAYPRRIALNACRNAMKSRPCVNARAHSEGEETREIEISLDMSAELDGNVDRSCSPSLRDLLADIRRFRKHAQARALRKVDVPLLCAKRR
jgi:hypothetical protein